MCSAMNAKRDRVEHYRTYTEALLQSFYKLKQTTRDHVDHVYSLTMGPQAPSTLDSYMGILRALEFLGAGIGAVDPKSLLISFVYERNKPIFDLVQDFNPSELECQAARSIWGFHELKVITAKWMQGKDEDQLVLMGSFAMGLSDDDASTTPRHVSPKDRQFASKAVLKRVWDQNRTQRPYIRLVRSLHLLGLLEKGEEPYLQRWLREKTGLKTGQLLDYPWDLSHLELVGAKAAKERARRSAGPHRGTNTHGGGHTRNKEARTQVQSEGVHAKLKELLESGEEVGACITVKIDGKDVEDEVDEDDEEMEEVEEVVRADFSAKPGDPTALRLFQAVRKARETAKGANKEVVKAYETVAWTSAELMTHLAKGKDHTDGSFGSKRHIEGPRQMIYPWRST
ncbi:hypothetical protein KVR01_012457 [Diaporthe batatas]|uniref:uncharacterized protein n=1 Tax=Diaporthe batatas TaxID=748121 RepID=UPI001D03D737|nr:uncharacterized protein KVR01_012457 [Diaporthe batatas]KAG8157795.1 hypothetical protein KVR01_012457 [Diaporthe batatas]